MYECVPFIVLMRVPVSGCRQHACSRIRKLMRHKNRWKRVSDWNEWEPIVSRRSRTTEAISKQYDFVLLVHTAHCATSCVGFYYLSEKFPAVAPTGCLCLCARTIAFWSYNCRLPDAAVHESYGARGRLVI